MDFERDLLVPVAARLRKRMDSLRAIRRFPRCDIEGWLKVEVVASLGDQVKAVQNEGCDLLLHTGHLVELKAATDLNPEYLRAGAPSYRTLCLFLGDGSDRARFAQLSSDGVRLAAHDVLFDGEKDWIVGLLALEQWTDLDQSKYSIDAILEHQGASPSVRMRVQAFHSELMKRLGSPRSARTHKRGITYLSLNENNERACVFLDVRRNFFTVKCFTGRRSIDGLRKANWCDGGDRSGSEPYKVDGDEAQERAIGFAIAAHGIVETLQ